MNIASLIEIKSNPNIPAFASGDTVKVRTKVVEGDKERIQVFQGVVIRVRNKGVASSFTVRRVSYGVGVERTFPFHSPRVENVEVARRGKVRRAKLYYLRGLSAKAARIKERRLSPQELEQEREEARKLEQEREQKLELARAEALKLKQEQESEQAAAEAPKTEQEPEPEQAAAEEPKLEQEPEPEQEVAEAPKLEQEPEPEQEVAEAPKLEQDPEPVSEQKTEEAPKLEQEPGSN